MSHYTLSIVRIVIPAADASEARQHVGMGALIDSEHVVTCCHVVNQACGRALLDRSHPAKTVTCSVVFPFAEDSLVTASVVAWGWSSSGGPDAAVLKLSTETTSPPAEFTRAEVAGQSWRCDGWDAQGIEREAEGRLGSLLAVGERQMNGREGVGVRIANGYSGTPVWCVEEEAFAGIVVTRDRDQAENGAAYMIPAKRLKALWPPMVLLRPKWHVAKAWPAMLAVALAVTLVGMQIPSFFSKGGSSSNPDLAFVSYQLFDKKTGERILRDFSLGFEGVERPVDSEHGQVKVSEENDVKVTKVDCEGYQSTIASIENSKDGDQPVRRCYVERDEDGFLESILPNYYDLQNLPTAAQIRDALKPSEENKNIAPAEVTFLVQNKTEKAIDVLLYCLTPPTSPLVINPIAIETTRPGAWSVPFENFSFPDGFFVISVSDSGKRAETVDMVALYQDKYAVLIVSVAGEKPVARVKFCDHDPRTDTGEGRKCFND